MCSTALHCVHFIATEYTEKSSTQVTHNAYTLTWQQKKNKKCINLTNLLLSLYGRSERTINSVRCSAVWVLQVNSAMFSQRQWFQVRKSTRMTHSYSYLIISISFFSLSITLINMLSSSPFLSLSASLFLSFSLPLSLYLLSLSPPFSTSPLSLSTPFSLFLSLFLFLSSLLTPPSLSHPSLSRAYHGCGDDAFRDCQE